MLNDRDITTHVTRERLQTVVLATRPRCAEVQDGRRCCRVLCHSGEHYAPLDPPLEAYARWPQ